MKTTLPETIQELIAEENLLEAGDHAQAYKDWIGGRAYWQQTGGYGSKSGYYKLKPVDSEGHPYNGKGTTAPWNKSVKKEHGGDVSTFHKAAHAWLDSQKK